MTHHIQKLSAVTLPKIKEPGMYADGGGLYLRVTPAGGKFWAFRFMMAGKAREMGLGAFPDVSLADARLKAADCRRLKSEGQDPIAAREDAARARGALAARSKTFKQCAEAYIEDHRAGWRNDKHKWQWTSSLEIYAYPIFKDMPVQEIDAALVLKVLRQKQPKKEKKGKKADWEGADFWTAQPDTASRVRGRIEKILDWAASPANKYRTGENPARWRGHLEHLLPKLSKVRRIAHQPALPYEQIGDFMTALGDEGGNAAEALAFTILTAARTGEAIGAAWPEIDWQKKIWTVPGQRMKGGREHRVPLSDEAIRVLKRVKKLQDDLWRKGDPEPYWIFDGLKSGRPLSNTAMLMLLRRMKRDDITVHGFRSTFRDWAAEQTNFPREVAELCLAHVSGDKVEQAYQRGDLFEKRRQLMAAWARYCATVLAKVGNPVVKMRGRG